MKKILLCIALILGTHAVSAKNKQQIFLTNEYGDAVMTRLSWKSNTFPYLSSEENIELREHDKNLMIKAPYSHYRLVGLHVSPKLETTTYLEDSEQSFEVPLVAVNEDALGEKQIGNNHFFLIKAHDKDSKIPGQKKIYMQGYTSQQKYTEQIAKTEKEIKEQEKQQLIKPVHVTTPQTPRNNMNINDRTVMEGIPFERSQTGPAYPTQAAPTPQTNVADRRNLNDQDTANLPQARMVNNDSYQNRNQTTQPQQTYQTNMTDRRNSNDASKQNVTNPSQVNMPQTQGVNNYPQNRNQPVQAQPVVYGQPVQAQPVAYGQAIGSQSNNNTRWNTQNNLQTNLTNHFTPYFEIPHTMLQTTNSALSQLSSDLTDDLSQFGY